MNKIFTSFLLIVIANTSKAQGELYLGAEVAYSAEIFKHSDPSKFSKKASLNAALWGINLRLMVSKKLFVETGAFTRIYKMGLNFNEEVERIATDRSVLILPLRAGVRIPVLKDAISFTPLAGVALCLADVGHAYTFDGQFSYNGTQINYDFTPQYSSQTFAMVQGGIGIDFRVAKRALITACGNYYSGLTKMMIQHIRYSVNNGPEMRATSISRGNFYSIGIGFRYRI